MAPLPFVSVVLNGHREGWTAHKSIKNLVWCVEQARNEGLNVETIAILDAPDQKTVDVFNEFEDFFDEISIVEERDLARARNKGIELARGKHVAFLDADDLWSRNWLTACANFFNKNPDARAVLHPEYSMYFDARYVCWKHEDSTKMDADGIGRLLFANPWTSLIFAPKSIFETCPYADSQVGSGFGYEDWHWNCNVLAEDYSHRVIPGTVHLIRQKPHSSLLNQHRSATATLRPTRLFDQTEKLIPPLGDILTKFLEQQMVFPEPPAIPSVPPYVQDIMRETSRFDDKIFPAQHRMDEIVHYALDRTKTGRIYAELRRCLGERTIDMVILAPWLIRGGADLAIILHVEGILRIKPDARVVVITTENSASAWADHLPAQVDFLELGRLCGSKNSAYLPQILLRLLIQAQPRAIHVIQSDLGWRLIRDHGKALGHASQLFASVYLDGMSPEGEKFGYARTYLNDCIDRLSSVFSDNQSYIDLLTREYGFPKDKFVLLYHPLRDAAPHSREWSPLKTKKKVLWASRINRQKRPDILFTIARRFPELTFDMYGGEDSTDGSDNQFLQHKPSNVVLKGPYDRFSAIDIQPYNCFLYTSESDGLPNILLEAGEAGLPIIAPAVGGISELIDDETGHLIGSPEDVDAYSTALKRCLTNAKETFNKTVACRDKIRKRHSWGPFMKVLAATPNYIDTDKANAPEYMEMVS